MEPVPIAIAVADISKSFTSQTGRIPVLDGVSIDVTQGAWVTVLGPSGCGKTTLIRIMSGLLIPDSGRIITDIGEGDPRGQIAYMPQSDTLLPWRTALDNAILASEIDGQPCEQAKKDARRLFSRFGLAGFENLYPTELSGGMRQRLALIRTFLAHREVLLLDEPLGSLDALTRAAVQEWLLDVWSELRKTILLVTHDIEEALLLSDRIELLSTRPARVRREFSPELPRPRSRTAEPLVKLKGEILELIHREGLDA
ncbi:MAG: ABC transporter ATP-binding protein [Candidatus Bipolaricaulota bacterium]|nr:ABC transporter ATP-binding protein [Candidatus Bipolaricaulota bacterium]